MQARNEWMTGQDVWAEFVTRHPELGYRPGKWAFHNFLRYFRRTLLQYDAIRRAKRKFWIGHRRRFLEVAFACATGAVEDEETAPVQTPPCGLDDIPQP